MKPNIAQRYHDEFFTPPWKRTLRRWWTGHWFSVLVVTVTITTGCVLYASERDRRERAEADTELVVRYVSAIPCYATEGGHSLTIVGGSSKDVANALLSAAGQADAVRMAWKVLEEKK